MSYLHLPQSKSDANTGCLELSGYILFAVLPSLSHLTVLRSPNSLSLVLLTYLVLGAASFMYHKGFHLIIRFTLL